MLPLIFFEAVNGEKHLASEKKMLLEAIDLATLGWPLAGYYHKSISHITRPFQRGPSSH